MYFLSWLYGGIGPLQEEGITDQLNAKKRRTEARPKGVLPQKLELAFHFIASYSGSVRNSGYSGASDMSMKIFAACS